MNDASKQLTQNILKEKKNDFIFGSIAHLFIFIGAIGLLALTTWAKTVTLIGLGGLLLYVWASNIWKLVYFQKLNAPNNAPARQELEGEIERVLESMEKDIMDEVVFDDDFYEMAVQKNRKKAIGKIVVGSAMIVPAILYLW